MSKPIRQESQVMRQVALLSARVCSVMRSYDEYCAIAKSLDLVGDRWTLLIVRELALRGACRYTDVRHGLPGIANNLLAERLRELERAGAIAREGAPAPRRRADSRRLSTRHADAPTRADRRARGDPSAPGRASCSSPSPARARARS